MNPFRVVCVLDNARPQRIPAYSWIEKNQTYTVVEVKTMQLQGGSLGFVLKELPLGEDCFPYEAFGAHRFRALTEDDAEAEEFAKQAALEIMEMNEMDYE